MIFQYGSLLRGLTRATTLGNKEIPLQFNRKMGFQYGTVKLDEDLSKTRWVNSEDSFQGAINYLELHAERSLLVYTIRRRVKGSGDEGELYMTYPFPLAMKPSQKEMEQQIKRIKLLCEEEELTGEGFMKKLTEIRLAYFPKYK